MFLFTGPPKPWSHRDHVQSSVHWTALRLFDELRYAHLTLQVGCFARGLECRVCPPLTPTITLALFDRWNPRSPHFSGKASPGSEVCRERGQMGQMLSQLPILPAVSSVSTHPLLTPGLSQAFYRLAIPAVSTASSLSFSFTSKQHLPHCQRHTFWYTCSTVNVAF